jgi:hypothetical protein
MGRREHEPARRDQLSKVRALVKKEERTVQPANSGFGPAGFRYVYTRATVALWRAVAAAGEATEKIAARGSEGRTEAHPRASLPVAERRRGGSKRGAPTHALLAQVLRAYSSAEAIRGIGGEAVAEPDGALAFAGWIVRCPTAKRNECSQHRRRPIWAYLFTLQYWFQARMS